MYSITFIFTACHIYGMETDNCLRKPDYTCQRCGRFFYDHEVVEIEHILCIGCVVEELWQRVKDLQERLED